MVLVIQRSRVRPAEDSASLEEGRVLLLSLLEKILEYADDIKVSFKTGTNTVVYTIDCNPADMGKLLGTRGKTINGIRAVLTAAMGKKGIRVVIEVPYIPPK